MAHRSATRFHGLVFRVTLLFGLATRPHQRRIRLYGCCQSPVKRLRSELRAGLELEPGARYSSVSLVHARGIFAYELPYNIPESGVVPEPRPMGDLLPPTTEGVAVMDAPAPAARGHFDARAEHLFWPQQDGTVLGQMVKTREIGVYVPSAFPSPKVEIAAVLDGQS